MPYVDDNYGGLDLSYLDFGSMMICKDALWFYDDRDDEEYHICLDGVDLSRSTKWVAALDNVSKEVQVPWDYAHDYARL
jgi:hypothetical protein